MVAAALSTQAAQPASAATGVRSCQAGMTSGGVVTPAGGHPFIVCSGRIRSFDGTHLDTDVTIPTTGAAGPLPLMVMPHGWGSSKTEWG